MGFQFRKSISLGKGARINLSKKGVGFSAGVKGARIGVGSKGAYTSTSIPGTGLYSVNYINKGKKSSGTPTSAQSSSSGNAGMGFLIIIGIIVLIVNPVLGFILFAIGGIAYYYWSKNPKQQAKKRLEKARKFFNQQNYEEATELLNEARDLDSENNDVVYLLGASYHNSEQYEKAIEPLKNFLAKFPEDIDVQMLLSNSYYKTEKYKEAIAILQKVPEDFEQYLTIIQLLGACFHAQKKYDLAIDVFKKAPLQKRKLDSDLLEVHYNLALIYEESGDKKNALKHFKKVYAHDVEYREVSDKIESLEK